MQFGRPTAKDEAVRPMSEFFNAIFDQSMVRSVFEEPQWGRSKRGRGRDACTIPPLNVGMTNSNTSSRFGVLKGSWLEGHDTKADDDYCGTRGSS